MGMIGAIIGVSIVTILWAASLLAVCLALHSVMRLVWFMLTGRFLWDPSKFKPPEQDWTKYPEYPATAKTGELIWEHIWP